MTAISDLIQKMQREIDELKYKLGVERVHYKELEQNYQCAITDLEHTRKELLRARS
jgi:hypothetical protein